MLSSHLPAVLTGMVQVGVGTFFAQASATGFVGQAAYNNRGVASGTHLACYFLGGLVGTAVLGQLFDRFGWTVCVAVIGAAPILPNNRPVSIRLRTPRYSAGIATQRFPLDWRRK
jgi:MFS transporter, YNFM family, putative membrane transport protein